MYLEAEGADRLSPIRRGPASPRPLVASGGALVDIVRDCQQASLRRLKQHHVTESYQLHRNFISCLGYRPILFMSSFNSQRRRQGFGASSNRSTFGYWVPLALTVTAATVGLAAWIWSERSEDEERDHDRKGDGRPPPVHRDVSAGQAPFPPGSTPRADDPSSEDPSVIARMSSALRRTPSPQQLFDGASRRVAAGVAAAGAVVGGALSSIREEDKGDFEDHSRWNEEAEARIGSVPGSGPRPTGNTGIAHEPELSQRQLPRGQRTGNKRKAVAIVVSAEISNHGEHNEDVAYIQEHAVRT